MKALIINCTLKPSPQFSNTGALAQKAERQLRENGITAEIIRLVDYNIKPGTEADMGNGDEWPAILDKLKAANIFIIATPVWMGHLASTAQHVIERLDSIFHDEQFADKETGQYITYNKVAGCLITGNEDGAHSCAAQVLWAMQELGFTIPPNVNAYWVGMAGGEQYFYTYYTMRWMIANLTYFAKLLKDNPITSNLKKLKEMAEKERD